jgi:hypothetical protein
MRYWKIMESRWRRASLGLLMTCLAGPFSGCSTEKNEYRQAGLLVGRSVAHIAAFAPFLKAPDRAPGGAAWRHGVKTARTEIMNHAVAIYDLRPVAGPGSTPAERLGRAIEPVVQRCALDPNEPPEAAIAKALDCHAAVAHAGVAFAHEDLRAEKLGLPRGTIPHLAPESITREASQAAAALAEKLQPPRAEAIRQRLWADPNAEAGMLKQACEMALRQARDKAPGVYEEINAPCAALEVAERVLKESQACGSGQQSACSGRSQCGLLESHAAEVPAAYVPRLRREAERCLRRVQEQLQAEGLGDAQGPG